MSAGHFSRRASRTSVDQSQVFEEPENSAVVRPLARASEGPSSVSVTWVSLDGRHRQLASRRSARLYYVLSGELTFAVADEEPEVLDAGGLLVIPKGVPYHLEGTGTYLVLNTPAFEAGDDEYSDGADGSGAGGSGA
ncbi:MAG TPA: cupin domain-containing protein, partial [Acidimicrobiales bacterium]|nr:cupin domain-containing protein [Acidimicrobiales bacterium]